MKINLHKQSFFHDVFLPCIWVGFFIFVVLLLAPAWAESLESQGEPPNTDFELNALNASQARILSYKPQVARQAEIIFSKCIKKSHTLRSKSLCESLKDAIHTCLSSEMRRDEAKAQGVCEKLFILAPGR
jgi:hypothetical protein